MVGKMQGERKQKEQETKPKSIHTQQTQKKKWKRKQTAKPQSCLPIKPKSQRKKRTKGGNGGEREREENSSMIAFKNKHNLPVHTHKPTKEPKMESNNFKATPQKQTTTG